MRGLFSLLFFFALALAMAVFHCPCLHAYPLDSNDQGGLRPHAKALWQAIKHYPHGEFETKQDPQGLHVKCRLLLKGLAGQKDEDHAFEDLDIFLNLQADGSFSPRAEDFSWTIKAAWPRGQVLFFPWFFDLSQIKGSLKARGQVRNGSLHIDDLLIYGPFTIKAGGVHLPLQEKSASSDYLQRLLGSNWQMSADIQRAYNLFVRDAFSDSHPIVKEFRPEGSAQVRGQGDNIFLTLAGQLLYRSKKFIDGLKAVVCYPLKKDRCEKGYVSWQDIYLGPLLPKGVFRSPEEIGISGKKLPVTLCHDRGSFGPLSLDLGNGTISFEEASFLFSHGTLMLRGIKIKDLKPHKLFREVPLEIVVEGNLPEARFNGDRLVFKGSLNVEVAGGMVQIKNIWIEPYAAILRWGADIYFKHINLKAITENTSFGLVTGAVEGWVKGLVMSGSQPEAFDLLVKTDEKASHSKKISIKAIENLSILGGGGGSVSFLGQLFKEFSYSKIGISCRLKNDVFELHGLYRKGDREYLVKRGFFGGVNVINMNPKGKISFRDMLDRLKRIGKSSQSKVEVR